MGSTLKDLAACLQAVCPHANAGLVASGILPDAEVGVPPTGFASSLRSSGRSYLSRPGRRPRLYVRRGRVTPRNRRAVQFNTAGRSFKSFNTSSPNIVLAQANQARVNFAASSL